MGETGWTLLPTLRLLQLRDCGTSDKGQQKVIFLTTSASQISTCKVWWKRKVVRVPFLSLSPLRLAGENICGARSLDLVTVGDPFPPRWSLFFFVSVYYVICCKEGNHWSS